jgi:hypothetical protein
VLPVGEVVGHIIIHRVKDGDVLTNAVSFAPDALAIEAFAESIMFSMIGELERLLETNNRPVG